MIKILDMTPTGYYMDKTPYYKFHNPFPRKPIVLESEYESVEKAYEEGVAWCNKYQKDKFPGGMACCLGVTPAKSNNGYSAVVSYYYSNS